MTRALKLLDSTYSRALSCVHCGLCLPACPTYLETGLEARGPRGRIQLIRGLSDGAIEPTDSVREHLDTCLDCRACETACPSNVIYHELIEGMRAKLPARAHNPRQRLMQWAIAHLVPYPNRMRSAMFAMRVLKRLGLWTLLERLTPQDLRRMVPESPSVPTKLPEHIPAARGRAAHGTVGLVQGCVASVLFGDLNRKTAEVLAACGFEVYVPPGQGCCGALHYHGGDEKTAQAMARRLIDPFVPANRSGPDWIVNTAAGCGAMMKEYGRLMLFDPEYAERAKIFASRTRDIHEILAGVELPEMKSPVSETVTYHDACHLAHGQRITNPPRELLGKIPGLKLIALNESDLCCGAAGSYNLLQPEMAKTLADRKLDCIAKTGANIVAAGNVGCSMHVAARARERGMKIHVVHPVELVHRAIFGTMSPV